ncbi:MAG: alpha-ribazole phosphatase [Bacteroidia bacterium]
MEIYLIRHSTPEIEKGICCGQSDIPLAKSFQKEYNNLMNYVPTSIDVVYTSPLTRCYEMATLIKTEKLITDARLLELNFGDWEMKKWEEIEPLMLNIWMNDFVNTKVPNGENFLALYTRVLSFIDDLIKQPHKNAFIITHAGVIRCFISYIMDIHLKNAFKINIDYSSVTKIKLEVDKNYNSISYLNKV